MDSDIKDLKLSKTGKERIEWVRKDMPVLEQIKAYFTKKKPFKGVTIGACLHVTSETANLMTTLKAGGAKVSLCASNPLSTQDDVAASLVKDYGVSTYSIRGEDRETYFKHINQVLDKKPQLTMDDGADLISVLHKDRNELIENVIGGSEETTTGVIRLKAMEKLGKLKFPVLAVNDSKTKHFFDNRYGTGQSTIEGIIRATNRLIAGSTFVVVGYGWCGRGLAMRADGMGANVIITEIDPVKALEALMDGFRVMPMKNAAKEADFICTITGNINVVDKDDFHVMKDGCIVCNSGHFNVEINLQELERMTKKKSQVREYVEEFELKDGRKIYVLGEGRLVNLVCATGHPASVMDMSFANQALGLEFMLKNKGKLEKKVYTLADDIDQKIARLKLKALGIKYDKLTVEQETYLESWDQGT